MKTVFSVTWCNINFQKPIAWIQNELLLERVAAMNWQYLVVEIMEGKAQNAECWDPASAVWRPFPSSGRGSHVQSSKQESQTELWSCIPYKAKQREEKSHLLPEQTLGSSPFHSVAWFCVITWISFYVPYQSNLSKFLFNLCLTRLICMPAEKEMRKF